MTTTDELRKQQDQRQSEVNAVTEDLELDQSLTMLGEPIRVGSVALGLMVRRDLDITVVCQKLNAEAHRVVVTRGGRLALHPRVRQVMLRDDTGSWNGDPHYPDGLYLGLNYQSKQGHDWNLDIWFIDEPERSPDLLHLRTLPAKLTAETRGAILQIKHAWAERPEYGKTVRSYTVYRSVLDDGVRSPEEFDQWLERRKS